MVAFLNAKTDFFYNISDYVPKLAQYPLITRMISDASAALADVTSVIPTPREIVAMIKDEELPIDPEDVAHNAYIEDSPLISFYPKENIGVIVNQEENSVNIFGISTNSMKQYMVANFSDVSDEHLDQTSFGVNYDMQFNRKIDIPETDYNELELSVYTSPQEFGEYTSWVLNLVHLVRDGKGLWSIEKSPVYDNNKSMFERDKSVSSALKSTPSIQSENSSVKSIAQQLTAECTTDYDKAIALHDWVCSYVFYDEDRLNSEETVPFYATDVIHSRRAVCLGFATLYASLCRSINIPCNVVSGYALGIGEDTEWTAQTINTDYQNHAWNEVYVDGRWVIVDTTWDTQNKISGGEQIEGKEISRIYFDSNLQFFSQNHKIIEYAKRR